MAIIKCKMCGGDLNIAENNSVAVCEYCGTQQTVPSADNEKKLTQFGRANRLRMACEFDKAAGVYESIVADFPEEAEAYWGLVLCKYGIEYVDDPATGKKIPTCHRSSFDSVMDDSNLDQALENADVTAQKVYREEAKQFERIRKGILEVSSSEKPYDIFICYKETDEKGDRTLDSVMAQDLYAALTDKGYRVFFSRITLQGKLGEAYEPYIFAALNSAKVMLAMGTCYEYYNAVWVKNEWSRYLKICEADKSKHLIPCYKDLDPEDMPREFKHLQGADLGKMGAVQDILFNMEKYIPLKKETLKETVVVQQVQDNATAPLLKRVFMFLEDGDWNRADDFCEQVLNINPECAEAYVGKLMAGLHARTRADLKDCATPFVSSNNYQKALRFGNDLLQEELKGYISYIEKRNRENAYNAALAKMNSACTEAEYNHAADLLGAFGDYKDAKELVTECLEKAENARKNAIYNMALNMMEEEKTEASFKEAARLLKTIGDHRDAATLVNECLEKAEGARKDKVLAEARSYMVVGSISGYESAIGLLETVSGWKDADERIGICKRAVKDMEAKARENAEAARRERERQERTARLEAIKKAENKKRTMKIAIIAMIVVCILIVFAVVLFKVVIPNNKYNEAVSLMENGQYEEAIVVFEAIEGYKDCSAKKFEAEQEMIAAEQRAAEEKSAAAYAEAEKLLAEGDKARAAMAFSRLDGYRDSRKRSFTLWDQVAQRKTIDAGTSNSVGITASGGALDTWDSWELRDWTDIIDIALGNGYTVGLKSNGTVVTRQAKHLSIDYDGQCDVSEWKDIVSIATGNKHTVGLKSDGTVIAVGYNGHGQCNVSSWTDIIAIAADNYHTVGLRADGTVVATEFISLGINYYGQCDVSEWKNIIAISAGEDHTVGLREDGTVIATKYRDHEYFTYSGACDVEDWEDIVYISAGYSNTVGVKSDGTVIATKCLYPEELYTGQCEVYDWSDIVAVAAGQGHTIGIRADGTAVATEFDIIEEYDYYAGSEYDGQCDIDDWTSMKVPK